MARRRSRSRLILTGIPAAIAIALAVHVTPPLLADGGDPTLIHACVMMGAACGRADARAMPPANVVVP